MIRSAFVGEAEAYRLAESAGIRPPRHGCVGEPLPFSPGEPVVLKGVAGELWHKSELGAVRFLPFDPDAVALAAREVRTGVESAGHPWIAGLVCERIPSLGAGGLPVEAFVSLSLRDAGWMLLFGIGGLQAEALSAHAPPLCLPMGLLTPADALAEVSSHLLGRVWLGALRGSRALTTRDLLLDFLEGLWRLARLADADGLSLLEMNPVALDAAGRPRPLDAVGRREARPPPRLPPPAGFLGSLQHPRSVALAGVSSQEGTIGRTILENLGRCPGLSGRLLIIKPGQDSFLGLPCVPDVARLASSPVDLLIIALPAKAASAMTADLIAQGGGAGTVALVSGGFGDGADSEGLGAQLAGLLRAARTAGRWTPAVLGPNFMGHWFPSAGFDTTFISRDRIDPPLPAGGPLVLLTQSGALMLCRRSRNARLALGLGISLGNEIDVALPDYLEALAGDPGCRAIAAYVEGFGPGHLSATLRAALKLRDRGVPLLIHRAGRTPAGHSSAATHTGALAGDVALERAVLSRVGVRFCDSIAAFDSALSWLGACPQIKPGPVALMTNAGFEAVNGSDQGLAAPVLDPAAGRSLEALLEREKLRGLVVPRIPLDLTPMAREPAYLEAAEILLRTDASALILGLVPFVRNIRTGEPQAREFAGALAGISRAAGKPVGVAVDTGPAYESFRAAFAAAGLPVFTRVEDAFLGLKTLFPP